MPDEIPVGLIPAPSSASILPSALPPKTGTRAGETVVRSICEALGWQPEHDDLDEIVTRALAWEAHLAVKQVALAGTYDINRVVRH